VDIASRQSRIERLQRRTDSRLSRLAAESWISRCDSSHSNCQAELITPRQLPTRLIYVGGSSYLDPPRLCVRSVRPGTHYTTLSHCWGTIEIVRLTQNTLEAFQRQIPLQELPKTFQDAIMITKDLGFHFIWIDSLCIIQGDTNDWRRESVLMSNVYGGSSLNIAASGAPDGNWGCFFPRDTRLVQKCLVMASHEEGSPKTLHYCVDNNLYSRCISDSPLNKRAWFFQERFLAPRTLHFGTSQLFWECRENNACETFPISLPEHFPVEQGWAYVNDAGNELYELWRSIVISYSQGRLTHDSDKLIAIYGVAKNIAQRFGGDYLAGLWRENLIEQLLWFVSEAPEHRPSAYRAPSWSWASVNGAVNSLYEHPQDSAKLLISILEVHVTKLEDAFGEVCDGILRVSCDRLVRAREDKRSWRTYRRSERTLFINGLELRYCHIWYDALPKTLPEEFYCLPIHEEEKVDEDDEHDRKGPYKVITGLLVEPLRDKKGHFRRVGLFQIYASAVTIFKHAIRVFNACAHEAYYEDNSGVDEFGRQRYSIIII
jgi:hypothetical protein